MNILHYASLPLHLLQVIHGIYSETVDDLLYEILEIHDEQGEIPFSSPKHEDLSQKKKLLLTELFAVEYERRKIFLVLMIPFT